MSTVESAGPADTTRAANASEDANPRKTLSACGICGSRRLHYAFSKGEHRIVQCADCRLLMLNPQPSDQELAEIYSDHYFLEAGEGHDSNDADRLKTATAPNIYRKSLDIAGAPAAHCWRSAAAGANCLPRRKDSAIR